MLTSLHAFVSEVLSATQVYLVESDTGWEVQSTVVPLPSWGFAIERQILTSLQALAPSLVSSLATQVWVFWLAVFTG